MFRTTIAALIGLVAGAAGDSLIKGRVLVLDGYDLPATITVATGVGDLYVEDALETDGNALIGGTLTSTGTLAATGAATVGTTLGVTGLTSPAGGVVTGVTAVSDTTALTSASCGDSIAVTAGIDTKTITLPEASSVLGCVYTISYIGADGGALVDISPLDSDADGIEGGCYETATDTVVYFSGTADADIGLTKLTALTGDYIQLVACNAAMWCVTGCQGIWANN